MPVPAQPSEAAQRALVAMLDALPPSGQLQLTAGQPATAVGQGGSAPLGRSPLTQTQVQILLGSAFAEAIAKGPGTERAWEMVALHRPVAVRLAWAAGGAWQVTCSRPSASSAQPSLDAGSPGANASLASAPERASELTAALAGLRHEVAMPPPAAAPAAPPGAERAVPLGQEPGWQGGPAVPAPTTAPAASLQATSSVAAQALPAALTALLAEARAKQAADLHLQAGQPVRLRIGGRLLAVGEVQPAERIGQFVAALVPAAAVAVLAQRGSLDFAVEAGALGRFRVNVGRQAGGYKICLRLVRLASQSLAELALPDDIAAVTRFHQGLAVFAGPKGHGKTTTMASVVHAINAASAVHIITVEDPIEVVHAPLRAVMSQRQVGTHTRSFARALKAALREDPDVIVIGELRDRETVEIALTAAETGHLVLATMSTRSAAKTVDRLIDFFPPDDQQQVRATLAGALKMVIAQRLLPSQAGPLLPAVEVMTGSLPLWTLIRENKMFQLPSLMQRGRSIGMLRLDSSLEALVKEGKITARMAHINSENPTELLRVLQDKYQYVPDTAEPRAARDKP